MARISNFPYEFSGNIQNVITYQLNGVQYLGHMPYIQNKKPNEAQLSRYLKNAMMNRFLNAMQDLLNKTFKTVRKYTPGRYVAYTINRNRFVGSYPHLRLDYEHLALSRGCLPGINGVQVKSLPGGLIFSWNNGETSDGRPECKPEGRPEDRVILVAYHEDSAMVIYNDEVVLRRNNIARLNTPALAGKRVHTWVVVMSEDGTKKSNSIYTGKMRVDEAC